MKNILIHLLVVGPIFGVFFQLLASGGLMNQRISKALGFLSSVIASTAGLWLFWFLAREGGSPVSSEKIVWIDVYHINYWLSLNGLNVGMLFLSSALFPIFLLYEWNQKKAGLAINSFILLLQSGVNGTLASQDLFSVVFFFVFTTIPVYFLVAIWGENDKEEASGSFLFTASAGNSLIFMSLILIYFGNEPSTFLLNELAGGTLQEKRIAMFGRELSLANVAFWLFSVGVFLRVPFWPFQGWYRFFSNCTGALGLAVFVGVLLPLAVFVFIQVGYQLFKNQLEFYSSGLMVVGIVNLFFGLASSFKQKELKLFFSKLAWAQIGLLLIGISSNSRMALVGVLYQCVTMGIGLAGCALFVGIIKDRTGSTRFIDDNEKSTMGGIANSAPVLATVTALLMVSIVGAPAIGSFVGQTLILMGNFGIYPFSIVAISIGAVLMTFATLKVYRLVFLGPELIHKNTKLELNGWEQMYFWPLVILVIALGIFPKALFDLMDSAVGGLLGK
jgi:NADH-quinone oxidoreductase subunit M